MGLRDCAQGKSGTSQLSPALTRWDRPRDRSIPSICTEAWKMLLLLEEQSLRAPSLLSQQKSSDTAQVSALSVVLQLAGR